MGARPRYRSFIADSARWEGIALRPGDIVISTPPKSGTTWMQMICALLVFQTDRFDRSMAEISPWVDMQTTAPEVIAALLEAQQHRRFMKSHTPLDGLPFDERVTYLCVGRDPRDIAISWDHHVANIDVDKMVGARTAAVGLDDLVEFMPDGLGDPPPADPADRFRAWVEDPSDHAASTLATTLHHLQTFWDRRDDPNIALFHYADLVTDLEGEMRRLASVLGIEIPEVRWPSLVDAAGFEQMRSRAGELAPDVTNELWKDTTEFFRRGSSGQWRAVIGPDEARLYAERAAALAPPDLLRWAEQGGQSRRTVEP